MEESASMEIQLENICFDGNEEENDELVIEIRNMFERPEIRSSECRIYKVPHHLRKWNEEAYTPQVISIGPFHHKNTRLKVMEEHKERYSRNFVQRSGIKLEDLVGTIREMEHDIRGCYEETIDLSSDSFVKMILVDASFILELFFRHKLGNNDLIEKPRAVAVMHDLVLLENQLPFFVIEKLYKLSPSHSEDHGLLDLSFVYFREFNNRKIAPPPNVKIEHFTDLLRTFLIPPPEKQPERGYRMINNLYTATQLHEVGVKFKVTASESCFDIKFGKFGKGVLEIPSLELSDRMEVVYRNIVALEQTRYIEEGYFSDYLIFMDLLIETRKDVDLLCDKNILGPNDSYAAEVMIKNLNKGILLINMRDDYVHIGKELNSFYVERPWRRRMALLKREYFSTPSQATSTIVTLGVITVLTLIQTVCSMMQVKGSS